MLPEVTVIVLNFNGRDYLGACLDSLLALDYPRDRLELLVVDNGSVDGSAAFVRQAYPDVRLLELPDNRGFAAGNNAGAQAARGTYLAFLNNDMRVDPRWLIEMVEAIQTADDVVSVGARILTWDGSGIDFVGGTLNFYGMGFQPEDMVKASEGVHEVLFACGGAMLIRRDIFLESGGFDESFFAYFEDVDLGWRLWVLGYRVLLAPRAVAYHRGHATGKKFEVERRALLYERNALAAILKNYGDETLSRVLPAALLLTARRAVMTSGLDKRQFRMETQPRPSTLWPPSNEPPPLAEGQMRRELEMLLREYGLWAVSKEIVRRILRFFYVRSVYQIKRDIVFVPRASMSPLLALDDIADMMPAIWAQREAIQAQRRRSDAEILPLFGNPFHPHPPDPAYLALQQRLVEIFHIDSLFPAGER